MSTASTSELRANLSRYLREVRRGGEVQVLDRGIPVARLVAPAEGDEGGVREILVRRGLLKPGTGNPAAILDRPPLVLQTSLFDALMEERTDRL